MVRFFDFRFEKVKPDWYLPDADGLLVEEDNITLIASELVRGVAISPFERPTMLTPGEKLCPPRPG